MITVMNTTTNTNGYNAKTTGFVFSGNQAINTLAYFPYKIASNGIKVATKVKQTAELSMVNTNNGFSFSH